MRVEGVIFGRGQYDVTTVQQLARVHEISSPYSFCYLISRNVHRLVKLLVCIFHESLIRTAKNTSQFQLVAGSAIHLLAYRYYSLWRKTNGISMSFLVLFGSNSILMVQIFSTSTSSSVSIMKTHVVCHLVNTRIYFLLQVVLIGRVDRGQCKQFKSQI